MANFKFVFDDVFMNKFIVRMDQNQDIFNKVMDDNDFGNIIGAYMLKMDYLRGEQIVLYLFILLQ